MKFTSPDPFITELEDTGSIMTDDFGATQTMRHVLGEYPHRVWVIPCWDKYITELREKINQLEQDYGLSQTSWTPLPYKNGKPYIWDKYIQELRDAAANLAPHVYPGKSYQNILQQTYGYNDWCNGEPLANNYIWDRCIDEIRRVIDPAAPVITATAACSIDKRVNNRIWNTNCPEDNGSLLGPTAVASLWGSIPTTSKPLTFLGFSSGAVSENFTLWSGSLENDLPNVGNWHFRFRKPSGVGSGDPYPGEPYDCNYYGCFYEWPAVCDYGFYHYREPVWSTEVQYNIPPNCDVLYIKKIRFPDVAHFYYHRYNYHKIISPLRVRVDFGGGQTFEADITENDPTIYINGTLIVQHPLIVTVSLPDKWNIISPWVPENYSWNDPTTWPHGYYKLAGWGFIYVGGVFRDEYSHRLTFDPKGDLYFSYTSQLIR